MHHGVHAHVHHRRQFGNFFGNGKDPLKHIGEEIGGFLTGNGNSGQNRDGEDNSDDSGNDDSSNKKPTKVSVVYYTPPPTFSGPIAGYSTMNGGEDQPSTRLPPATTAAPRPSPSQKQSEKDSPSPTPDSEPTSSSRQQTSLIKSTRVTSDSILSQTGTIPSNAAASSTGGADLSAIPQSNEMSTGAKAGIAVGVIFGVLFLIGAAYAIYRHRQNQAHRSEENEKNPFGDHAASHHATVSPPPAAMAAVPAVVQVSRSMDTINSNAPSNPFGSGAQAIRPVPSGNNFTPTMSVVDPEKHALAVGAGATMGAAAIAAAAANRRDDRQHVPQQLDINRSVSPALAAGAMPSPAVSQFSNASMTSTAIAAGAPATNVHRVQMDFTPSMEDEIELKQGQLVRVLHEYDDGWVS